MRFRRVFAIRGMRLVFSELFSVFIAVMLFAFYSASDYVDALRREDALTISQWAGVFWAGFLFAVLANVITTYIMARQTGTRIKRANLFLAVLFSMLVTWWLFEVASILFLANSDLIGELQGWGLVYFLLQYGITYLCIFALAQPAWVWLFFALAYGVVFEILR